jgi:sporulation integral membrane protein YtvI
MQNKEQRDVYGHDWIRTASMIFCILAGAAATYIAFRYLFVILLPLIIGAALGALASAVAKKLSKYTGASRKVLSFSVLLVLLSSLGAALFLAVRRLVTELGKLADGIGENGGVIGDFFEKSTALISNLGEKIASRLPGSDAETIEKINGYIEGLLGNVLSSIGSAVPGLLSSLISSLPNILLGAVAAVIVAFYFTLDSTRIKNGIISILPASAERLIPQIKKEAAVTVIGYLRSYSLILLITFAEIFFGLSVLGIEYSFIIAAVCAAIDILPILGVGIVLIPWALWNLMAHNLFHGIGLIILYVIIVVVRQFIEPKIVGESLGLHPLITLAAFYLGYRLFGFAGILIAPIALVLRRGFKASSAGNDIKNA